MVACADAQAQARLHIKLHIELTRLTARTADTISTVTTVTEKVQWPSNVGAKCMTHNNHNDHAENIGGRFSVFRKVRVPI